MISDDEAAEELIQSEEELMEEDDEINEKNEEPNEEINQTEWILVICSVLSLSLHKCRLIK